MAVVNGTSGYDTLYGTLAADTLTGYAGDDVLNPGRGSDVVFGWAGADTFYWDEDSAVTRAQLDVYVGGDTGEHYDTNIYGDLSGGDMLVLGATAGSAGFHVVFSNSEDGYATDAYGNKLEFSGMERLRTGDGRDIIDASRAIILPERNPGGSDNYMPEHGLTIMAGGGNDLIRGTAGVDVLDGGSGNDCIFGGDGNDLLMSSAGDDYGNGGPGDDNVRWGNNGGTEPIYYIGNDTLMGGSGSDLLNLWAKGEGENSTGTVVTFTANDSGYATYVAGNGRVEFSQFELFWTHEGKDTVSAASADIDLNARGIYFNTRWGDDRLTGSAGRDTLEGGEGADTINGGRGNDIISMCEQAYLEDGSDVAPDSSRDVLILQDNFGVDRVRAFQVGNSGGNLGDRLNVTNLHDANGNRIDVDDVTVNSNNGNALLRFPNGEVLILEGVSPSSITRAALIEMGIPASTAQASAQISAAALGTDAKALYDAATDAVDSAAASQSADFIDGSLADWL